MPFTPDQLREIPHVISAPRFATYLRATEGNSVRALELYQWNLELSSAFLIPLQVAEVAVRNGVVFAIERQYGLNWHQSPGFAKSLPKPATGYKPYVDFTKTLEKLQVQNNATAGKIVAELKFAFWESMLTRRHDNRLWRPFFTQAFPNADVEDSIYMARQRARNHLEEIRKLRNRIAHHEPIFTRNTMDDYNRILDVIRWRSTIACDWVDSVQTVVALSDQRPDTVLLEGR